MNEQPPPERATGERVGPQVRTPFQLRPEVEGSFRKETEENSVGLGRNKCSRGHTGKVREGRGIVWTWIKQEGYTTLSECRKVWEQ